MTRNEVTKIVMDLKLAFPNWEIGKDSRLIDALIKLWQDDIGEFDFVEAERAVKKYRLTGVAFAPQPGQIAALIRELRCEHQLHPEIAWDRVITAIKTGTPWEKFLEKNAQYPRVVQATRSIGWSKLRNSEESQNAFLRAAFIRTYKNLHEQQKDEVRAITSGNANVQALVSQTVKQLGGVQ